MSLPAPRRHRSSTLLRFTYFAHAAGLLTLALRPSAWALTLSGLFANHVVLAHQGVAPRSLGLGPNLRNLPTDFPGVALTFDDGPDPEITPRVLDLLQEADHRATFFLIGANAERHPALVGEILERGHQIENHTQRHSGLFSFYPPTALRREISTAQELLTRLTGRPPVYFRPPAGVRSPWLEPVLARLGLHLVSWTRRGFDTSNRNLEIVYRRLARDLAPGDILMMHDRRLRDGRAPILEVLPRLLDDLERRQLRSRPLPPPAPAD